jgi:chorismate mutase
LEASGLSVGLSLSEKTDSLDELRKRIERVTLEIFDLCGERLQLAKQIGERFWGNAKSTIWTKVFV